MLDNLESGQASAFWDLPDGTPVELYVDDLLDPAALRRALEGVDAVIHLAALASTPFSFSHPTLTRHVNQWGTARLVEQCLKVGVERFVLLSSASVYGPGGVFHEGSPCRPVGPYSQTKLEAENSVLAARKRMEVSVLRLGTLLGQAPGIRYQALPNRFAFLAATGRPMTVYGDGEQKRPLVYVDDAVEAVLKTLAMPEDTSGKIFNVSAGNYSVNDLTSVVWSVRPLVEVRMVDQDVRSHWSLEIDSQAFEDLGWTPERQFKGAFQEMIEKMGPFSARPSES